MSADAPSTGRVPRVLHDLWLGATTTSRVSWIGAAVVCVVELALCCVVLTPRRVARLNPRLLMETPGDEYCRLSIRLLKLRLFPAKGLEVAYAGPSDATRALRSRDGGELGRELGAVLGRPVAFHVLSANNERYEEAVAIGDQLPRTFRGVFVLVVHAGKNDYRKGPVLDPAIRRRLAVLASPSLDALWRADGIAVRRTGVFFLDHLEFFASRRIAAVRFGPPPAQELSAHLMDDEERVDRARATIRRRAGDERKTWLAGKSRRVVGRLLDNMYARQVPALLVESPTNPLREEYEADELAAYRAELDVWAREKGARYVDFNPELGLTPADFQDHVHLGSDSARERFQRRLLKELADTLDERYPADPGTPGDAEPPTEQDER